MVKKYHEVLTIFSQGLEKLGSRLMIFEVKNEDITQQEAAIPTKITGVPETMKLHQVGNFK